MDTAMASATDKPAKPKADKAPKGEKAPKGDKPAKSAAPSLPTPPPRLKVRFANEIAAKIKQDFGVTNPMALPRLDKIVVTVGVGKQLDGSKLNPKARETVLNTLTVITGQKPVMQKAKRDVSNFKLRAGYEIGALVTMRGDRMWEFLDRLITLAIPRIKDFRGLKATSFDGRGNYNFGVSEQAIFPEVDMTKTDFTHGLKITLTFRNSTDAMSRAVLTEMGFPFAKPEESRK
jgi:large subunit ribosomal protein L5